MIRKDWSAIATIMDDVAITTIQLTDTIDLLTLGYEGVSIYVQPAFIVGALTDELVVEVHSSPDGVNDWSGLPLHEFQISGDDAFREAVDATEALKLHDADGAFTPDVVGKLVKNLTDDTFATITAFVDSGELTLDTDIFTDTEEYSIIDTKPLKIIDYPFVRLAVKRSASTDTIDTTIKVRRWRWTQS